MAITHHICRTTVFIFAMRTGIPLWGYLQTAEKFHMDLMMGLRVTKCQVGTPPTFLRSDVIMSAGNRAKLGPSIPCRDTTQRLAVRGSVTGVLVRTSSRAHPPSAATMSLSAYCQRQPALSRWVWIALVIVLLPIRAKEAAAATEEWRRTILRLLAFIWFTGRLELLQ